MWRGTGRRLVNLGAVGKCQREEGGRRKGAGQSSHLCCTCQEPIGRDARSLDPREKSVGRGAVTPVLRVRTLKPQVSDVPKLPRNRVAELGFR